MVFGLKAYMGGRYVTINQNLRTMPSRTNMRITPVGHVATDDEQTVLLIDKELDSLGRPVPGNHKVYRKAGSPKDYAALNVAVGSIFCQSAYLSTSANNKYSYDNCKLAATQEMFFTITCKAMGYGRDVVSIRGNLNEAEVLFHRNVRFLVDEIESDDRGNAHWVMSEQDSPQAGFVWGAQTFQFSENEEKKKE